jgi:hypothetical protein
MMSDYRDRPSRQSFELQQILDNFFGIQNAVNWTFDETTNPDEETDQHLFGRACVESEGFPCP